MQDRRHHHPSQHGECRADYHAETENAVDGGERKKQEAGAGVAGAQHPATCITIYVVDHCELCEYALQMAEWMRRHYPQVKVRVVNMGRTTEPIPESVFAAPTYLLNGKVWSLGNPSETQVHDALVHSAQ